uniref:GRIP domain-containing protein n=1 Tax=Strongyloides venezuelensis TaxID=75913 RepID=A0A0K0EVL8_STRVS
MINQNLTSTDLLMEVEKLRQSEASLAAEIRKMTEEHNYDNKRLKDKINSLLICVNEGKLLQDQVTYLQNNILTTEREKNEALIKMENAVSLSIKQDLEIKDLQQKYTTLLLTKTDLENQLKVWIDKCCFIAMEGGNKESGNVNKINSNGDINLNDYQIKISQQTQTITELENELKRKNADILYKENRISQILGHIDLLEKELESLMKEKERFTRNVKLEELEGLQNIVSEKTKQCDQITNAFYELQEQYKILDSKYREIEGVCKRYRESLHNANNDFNERFSSKVTEYDNKIKGLQSTIKEKDNQLEEMEKIFRKVNQIPSSSKILPTTLDILDEMERNINKLSELLSIQICEGGNKKGVENGNSFNEMESKLNHSSIETSPDYEISSKTINSTKEDDTSSDLLIDENKLKVLQLERKVENLIEKLLESENKSIVLEMSLEKLRSQPYIYDEASNNFLGVNERKQIQNNNPSQTNTHEEIKKPPHIPLHIWEKINIDRNLCLFLKHQQEKLEHLETENDSMHEVYQLFFRKLRDDLSKSIENGSNIVDNDIVSKILQNHSDSAKENSQEEKGIRQSQNEEENSKNLNSINECFNGTGKIIEI